MQRAFAPLLIAGYLNQNTGQLSVRFSRTSYDAALGPSPSPSLSPPSLTPRTATLVITAFRWSGGMAGAPLKRKVALPPTHSSALIYSSSIEGVLAAAGCSARAECVLKLDLVTEASPLGRTRSGRSDHQIHLGGGDTDRRAAAGAGTSSGASVDAGSAERVFATNHVYLSPFHQVTTMVRHPGLKIQSVVAAAGEAHGGSAAGRGGRPSFTVTVSAAQLPVPMVWLETALGGRWSENGMLLTTPALELRWTSDGDNDGDRDRDRNHAVTAEILAKSLKVWSLVDVASGYSSATIA
jgi:hypothetical protein